MWTVHWIGKDPKNNPAAPGVFDEIRIEGIIGNHVRT